MILFHGSRLTVEHPCAGGSNPHNDYGPAFYLTDDVNAAKSWACRNESLGMVNKYSIDNGKYASLQVLDLRDKDEYGVLHWLAILMRFRSLEPSFVRKNGPALQWLSRYYIDVSRYDVVIGYRADGAYFRFPRAFLSGDLAYEDLESVYRLGELGTQIVFVSEEAISMLRFQKAIPCESAFLRLHYETIQKAMSRFDEILLLPRDITKHYVLDLMRAES